MRAVLYAAVLLLITACTLPGADLPAEPTPASGGQNEPRPMALPAPAGSPAPACPAGSQAPITHLDVLQPAQLPEPPARLPFRDPIFGTCLVRVTDRRADLAGGDQSAGMVNEYSRVQSFNADGSLLLARSLNAGWYIYDASSLKPLGTAPFEGAVDPRWDAANPHLLYYHDGTRLMAHDLSAGVTRLVRDFSADFPGRPLARVWSRYEGSPSLDGRWWGFMAQDDNDRVIAFLVYDLKTNQVTARREFNPPVEVDSVTISPLGAYFLAQFDTYCQRGVPGSDQHPCGLMVYDAGLKNGRSLLRIVGHSDTALDAAGREVFIYQDIDTDHISVLDLASGQVTPLLPLDFDASALGLHFSGRGFRLPGWALVSTYNGAHPHQAWMDDSIFAVELKPNGRVVRLAHTRSVYNEAVEQDYWAEPHASANPDFTRVVFTSNWGRTGTEEVELYLLELPAGWSR